MCVMITEIYTIEGGQKGSLLTRGDQIFEKKIIHLSGKVFKSFRKFKSGNIQIFSGDKSRHVGMFGYC